MMFNRLSYHTYTNNILRDAKSMHNILKGYVCTENIIHEYLSLLLLYRCILKSFKVY